MSQDVDGVAVESASVEQRVASATGVAPVVESSATVVQSNVSVVELTHLYVGEAGGKYKVPLFIGFSEYERTPVGRVIRGVIETERDKATLVGSIEGFIFNEQPQINFGVFHVVDDKIPHYFPVEFARRFTELTKHSPESRFSHLNSGGIDCYVGEICGNIISGKVLSTRPNSVVSPERRFDPTWWSWDKQEEWSVKLVDKNEWLNRLVYRQRSDF